MDITTIGIGMDTSGLLKGTAALKENERQAGRTADAADRTGAAAKRASDSFSSLGNVLRGLGVGLVLREFVQLSDQYTKYTAQLKLATDSTQKYNAANSEVQRIAKLTEGGLGTIGVLYARITNATRELGVSQAQVSKVSETVGLSLKVAGATAAESSSAMLQLSQAFGAGALRGEEFNAVNEAAPGLLRILAESMGVTQGALKKLAEDGKLVTPVLLKAFTDERVLAGLREQATQVRTISGAIQLFKDQLVLFVGESNNATGAGAALANIIGVLARNLDLLAAAGIGFVALKIAQGFASIGAQAIGAVTSLTAYVAAQKAQAAATLAAAQAETVSRQATLADAQAKAVATQATLSRLAASNAALVVAREETIAQLASANASALSATAQINAARSAGALSFALATLRQGEVALTAAMAARTVATAELAVLGQQQARVSAAIAAANAAQTASNTALAASQAALTAATAGGAAATGLATRALGLLGGPIGVIATVLSVGVSAWLAWGGSAKKQSEDATATVTGEAVGLLASLDEQIRKLKERNALAASSPNGFDVSPTQEKILQLQTRFAQLARETGKTEAEEIIRKRQLQTIGEELAPILARQNTLISEQAIAQKNANAEAAKVEYIKYASDAQKLAAELERVKKALGGSIPPDLEKSIRDTFGKKTAAEVNKLAEEYKSLIQRLDETAEGLALQAKQGDNLTAGQKLQLDIIGKTEAGLLKLTAVEKARVELRLKNILADEKQIATQREFTKALEESEASRIKGLIAGDESIEKLEEENNKLREEIELIGLSERAQLAVIQARNESAIAIKEELLARRQALDIGREENEQLQREIDGLRDRNELLGRKFTATESADTYKNLADEGKRFAEQLEQGLTDSLFRAFEAGRGFFSTLWDGIKNLFKTTVLKLAIQGTVGGVLGSVGLAGAEDGTGGSGGAGGLINTANTLKKIYESFTNGSAASIISAFGTGGFAGSAAGYSEIAFQFSGALADAGFYETAGLIADNAAILSQGAAVVGAALTAYSIVAAFDAGEYGKAIGTAIGYYFFGDLGGAIGGYLGGVVDSFFGGGGDNRGGNTHGGGVYSSNGGFLTNDAQVGAIFNLRGEAIKDLTQRADAQVSVLVGALAVSLQNAAANVDRILGTKALQEITLGLAIDLKGYGKDVLGYFNLVGADGERVNYANRDLSSNPQEAFKELSDAAAQAIVDGLRGADIPAYARDIFSGIEAEAEAAKETLAGTEFLQEFITKLQEAEQFAKTLQGLPINALNSISIEAAQSLAKLSGGIENLTSNLEGYLTNFYSEAELQASAFANLQNAFGQLEAAGAFTQTAEQYQRLLVEPTRASFRALVDAQDLNTEAGRRTYTALLALSGAVSGVLPPLDELDAAVGSLGQSAAGAAQILSQRTELEIRLLRLTGNEIAAVAREREIELAALHVSNRVLAQYAYSIEDAQAAVELATQAAAAQTKALEDQQSAQQQAMAAAQESVQRWMAIAKDAGGLLNDIGVALGGGSNREAELLAALETGTAEDRLSVARELFAFITQTGDVQTQQQQQALQNAQAMLSIGRSLRGFVDGLLVGDLSALTPAQKLAEAQQQYQTTLTQAQAGNADAQQALQGTASTYLQLAREFSPEAYATAIFPAVTEQIGLLGNALITDGEAAAAMQQALIDAATTSNNLSAEQVAKLTSLQGVVAGILNEARASSASAMMQEAIAQAQLSAIGSQITASIAAEAGAVLQAQNALLAVQQQAAAHLAIIAASSGTVGRQVTNIQGQQSTLSPDRASQIQAYAASLPQNDDSIATLIRAAQQFGVTPSELDAALGLAPGLSAAGALRFGIEGFTDPSQREFKGSANPFESEKFATGGAFTNGIVSRPTRFNMGEMGEGGQSEAIMPLVNIGGSLGVRSTGNNDALTRELLAEVRALREEVKTLREDQNAGRSAQLVATGQQTTRLETAMVEGPSRAERQKELAGKKVSLI